MRISRTSPRRAPSQLRMCAAQVSTSSQLQSTALISSHLRSRARLAGRDIDPPRAPCSFRPASTCISSFLTPSREWRGAVARCCATGRYCASGRGMDCPSQLRDVTFAACAIARRTVRALCLLGVVGYASVFPLLVRCALRRGHRRQDAPRIKPRHAPSKPIGASCSPSGPAIRGLIRAA